MPAISSLAAVSSALSANASTIVTAGPNLSTGIPLTSAIAWSTPTSVPQASVTMAPDVVDWIATVTDDGDFSGDFSADAFDTNNPDIEIIESFDGEPEQVDNVNVDTAPEENNVDSPPAVPTKVAGAFGPGGVPAAPDDGDFYPGKGPVPPSYRQRQKDKSERKKNRKGKSKQAHQQKQAERKAYLAQKAAEALAAQAAAAGNGGRQ